MTDTTTTPDAADEAVSEHALGELEHIDPTSLQVGDNIREYANLDKAFLDSIAEHGVLVPITAIRRPTLWWRSATGSVEPSRRAKSV